MVSESVEDVEDAREGRPLRHVRRSRRSPFLKSFAVFAVVALVLTAFGILSQGASAETATGDLSTSGGDADAAGSLNATHASWSAGPWNGSVDSPGGPPPASGFVTSSYLPPAPTFSELPPSVVQPRLANGTAEYRYVTTAGVYVFPKSTPYLLRYETSEGAALVYAATFVPRVAGASLFQSVRVVQATQYRFEVLYSWTAPKGAAGNVSIGFDFSDRSPPKITAVLGGGDKKTSLGWIALTTDTFASNGSDTVGFASLSALTEVPSPALRLEIGPDPDSAKWPRGLTLDWGDAGTGRAFVGPITVGSLTGAAVLVAFPEGMRTIDPKVVGTSTVQSATESAIQRKAFSYAGRSWAFWYDPSAIVYSSSQDGIAWNSRMIAAPASVINGFDVDQRDGTVFLGLVCTSCAGYAAALQVRKGTILGSSITWTSAVEVIHEGPQTYFGVPTVSIGSDGYHWVAVPYNNAYAVYRSSLRGGMDFVADRPSGNDFPGASANAFARLLRLGNGWMYLLTAVLGENCDPIGSCVRRYLRSTAGWERLADTSVGWDQTLRPQYAMSAVVLFDGTIRLAYRGPLKQLLAVDMFPGLQYPFTYELSDQYIASPTLSLDPNGDTHVFYLVRSGGGCNYQVYYVRSVPLPPNPTWRPPVQLTTGGLCKVYTTAFPLAENRLGFLWTQTTSPGPYSVMFGAVPTPLDLGSQTGQPWNRQGISPYQSYFQQFSEFVSPGSGLLTLKQTDLSVPGRGLDLEISRVFVTPRAFSTFPGSPSAYLYEEYPAANLGPGWGLNLPWISDQYLHLWDGQMYVLRWQDDAFENHDGEHFLLTRTCGYSCTSYTLTTKGGLRFEFNGDKQLRMVVDPSGNAITVCYSATCGTGTRIDHIVDTPERAVGFTYNEDGTLASVSNGVQTVTYTYGSGRLAIVRDPLGRETRFEYTDLRSPYLVTAVRYPTGARTVFTWSTPSIQIGPDLQAYYVIGQDTRNSMDQSVRKNAFEPTTVNGKVTYTKVTVSDAGVAKGSTLYYFDSTARRVTTVQRDATGNPMAKQVAWFDSSGAVGQVDVYPGGVPPSYSVYTSYDEWGNPIYSRDGIGHEKFASYVNTRNQGGFAAPGRFSSTGPALLFDDFEDRDTSDWSLDATAGPVSLDYSAFETVPPALKIVHSGGGTGVASATHTFLQQSGRFVAEFIVRAEENTKMHYLLLKTSTGTPRVYFSMRDNTKLSWYTDQPPNAGWHDLAGRYEAKQWYRIAFEVFPSSSGYNIWVNGTMKYAGALFAGTTGTIDRVSIQSSCVQCGAATTYVDTVQVHAGLFLQVTGLAPGKVAVFENAAGGKVASMRVPSGWSSVILEIPAGIFPYGTLKVYDREGNLEGASTSHEFWGGGTSTYTPPWSTSSLAKSPSDGFLEYAHMFYDDGAPPGTLGEDNEGWLYGDFDYPPSGTTSHLSAYTTQMHQHYYYNGPIEATIYSGEFHVQYIYLKAGSVPSEIMLQFQDSSGSFEHRAYWGDDLINMGSPGTPSRRPMGNLPTTTDRWLMLVVKGDDVVTGGSPITPIGHAYTLFGGEATWDFTAKGDHETGSIVVAGLTDAYTVTVYDAKGNFVTSAAVPAGLWHATLDLYAANVHSFPYEGFLVIKNGGTAVYRSPVLTLWGGDSFTYSATPFYANAGVDAHIHDRLAGTLEYQTGRISGDVPQDAYFQYDAQGLLDRGKVREIQGTSTIWRDTSVAYGGSYGLPTSITDPFPNTVTYAYSPTYSQSYVTKVSDAVGTIARSTYDPRTGWPLTAMDGRGYRTRYAYDLLGRQTAVARFDLPDPQEILYWDMEWTTEETTPKAEDLSQWDHHGTFSGTTPAPGKVGFAREFDGSGDYVSATDSSNLDVSGSAISIAAWVYPKSSSSSNVILNKENSYEIALNGGQLQAAVETAASGIWAWGGTTTIPLNAWSHVAFVYDDSQPSGSKWKFYVNGVLRESIAPAGGQTGDVVPSDYALRVGDRSAVSAPFVGVIDEVRVLVRAVTSGEVASLHDDTFRLLSSTRTAYDDNANVLTAYEPTTKPRLVHLDMEALLNGKLEDLAGQGFHGTLYGTTTVSGRFGNARNFPGTSGTYVDLGDVPRVDFGSEAFTLSAWIKLGSLAQTRGMIMAKDNSGGGGRQLTLEWDPTNDNSNRIRIAYYKAGDAGVYADTATNVIADTTSFHHIVAGRSGGSFFLYLDGVSKTLTTVGTHGSMQPTASALRIGSRQYAGSTDEINAVIDEVQVFDRALTSAEVTELFQGTEKGFYSKQYFDSLGRATRIERRDLFSTSTARETRAYDFRDQVVSRSVDRSTGTTYTTTYAYDILGRPTAVTSPGANNPGQTSTLTVGYDDPNRIRTIVGNNGRKTAYVYDDAGRTTFVREYVDPVNLQTTSYSYDDGGNLVTVTNALNQATWHTYDNLNRLTKTTYPDTSKYEEYTYDAVGNLKTRTDRSGVRTTYYYDTRYRMDWVDYPGTDSDVGYAYDLNDNPTWIATPSIAVSYLYDGLDRTYTENTTIAGAWYSVGYEFDEASRVTRLTYPDNTHADYAYDAVGRSSQVSYEGTTLADLWYFADDLPWEIDYGNGAIGLYTYNGRGWPDHIRTGTQSPFLNLYYSYDESGNVAWINSENYVYDGLDRLTAATGGFGFQFYGYDAMGNRKRLDTVALRPNDVGSPTQWTKSGTGGWNWDRVDDVSSDDDGTYVYTSTVGNADLYALQDNGQAGAINAVTVSALVRAESSPGCNPDCVGAIKLRLGGSVAATGSVKYVGTSYALVSETWLTEPGSGGGAWTDADLDGLQAGIEFASGGTASTVRVTELFVSVNVGDSVTYAYADGTTGMDTLTSLVKAGVTTSFTYDANGNLDTKTGGWDYDWNAEDLMTYARLGGVQQQAYAYDGLGRRVKVDGATGSGAWTVSIFAGLDPVYERDQSGAVTKYVFANGMRIAGITPQGTVQYYFADALGSTRHVRDSANNLLFSTEYDPFGKPYNVGGTNPETYKYTSEKHDEPTGLVYLRARQYDPEIGRFVSADPVLGSPGMPQRQNRYTYVTNNPLRYADPSGMDFLGDVWNNVVGGAVCVVTLPLCVAQFVIGTAHWLTNRASWQEAVGFFTGVAAALVVGFLVAAAIAAFCVATIGVGCIVAAVVIGSLAGAVASSLTYIGVTSALGGRPTQEGLGYSFGWGLMAGGIGGNYGAVHGANWAYSRMWEGFNRGLEKAPQGVENWRDKYGDTPVRYIYDENGGRWAVYKDTRIDSRIPDHIHIRKPFGESGGGYSSGNFYRNPSDPFRGMNEVGGKHWYPGGPDPKRFRGLLP